MKQRFLNPFLYLLLISLPLSVSNISHLEEKRPRHSVMGSSISRARALLPLSTVSAKQESVGPAEAEKKEKVDYMNLPCPVPYCLLQDEAWRILELPHQEGPGITLVNKLNERFFLQHKITMESMFSNRSFAFSAVFHDPKFVLDGEIDTDGIWTADVKYNLTNNSFFRMISKMTNERRAHSTFWFYYKGKDYQSRLQYKNTTDLCSADYIQSVTPNLSLGTEVLWQPEHNISQISFAARYNTNKMIASGRVWNEGAISLSYIQILSEKVSLASEIEYVPPSGYFLSSIGYQYKFREMDNNGVISAYIEKKIRSGIKLVLYTKIDHVRKNYKYGYTVNIGGDQNLNIDS